VSSHDWQIEKSKITDYLLNERHPQGKAKALWFQSHGFHRKKWRVLSNSIRALLENRESEVMTKSPFGYRIVIRGTIPTPQGNTVRIITVWQRDRQALAPRLITAYPERR